MSLEILLSRYLQNFNWNETLHACTSDMEENEAEEAAGWRTKWKPETGMMPEEAVLSFPQPVSPL